MSDIPESLWYSPEHLWAKLLNFSLIRVGITDFAQESLGDVIDIKLPVVGADISTSLPCGEIESNKSVSELIAPVTGTVEQVNQALNDRPEIVNTSPYADGWIFDVRVDPSSSGDQLAVLLDAEKYKDHVGG
jgi:glycine cleavage system H protein